jgi:hypothetical protein
MKQFVLVHSHAPGECAIAHAAWSGFDSPLRGRPFQSTCARFRPGRPSVTGDGPAVHETWWTVDASDAATALALLPSYVRERTQAREVSELIIG